MQNGFAAQSLKVTIHGSAATTGTVSIPLASWSSNFTIAANGVAVVTVPNSAENTGSETVLPKGVLIEAGDSVNVFISSFQNFTLDNSQVLPESSIGDRYRVDAYHGVPGFNNLHKSELLIVATQDGTQVQITPSVATFGGQLANVPFTVDLDEGETYQVQAAFDHLDLTGTLIEATASSGSCRPFAVYGGSMCANIPNLGCSACDHIFEQLVPVNAWGTKYFTVPVNGVNGYSYRVQAHENNTAVNIGGTLVATLNAGQKYEANGVSTPVCIEADKPISVVQLLEGIACAGSGDPSMIILSPQERISRNAVFQTLSSTQLNQHSISLVVPLASVGQVLLDGTAINSSLFQNYAGCATHKHAKIAVPPGVHQLSAADGFQLYMFGLGSGESYASAVHDIRAEPVIQDSLICGDGTITLNAPGPWIDLEWTAASAPEIILGTSASLTITPTASDSYTVTGTLTNNDCPQTFTYHVGVPLTVPTSAIANGGNSISICQNEQVQLGLDPPPDPAWFDIQWTPAGSLDDPTVSDPIATPITSTWYVVEVTSPTGCGSAIDSVFVDVSPGQILDMQLTATPAEICAGDQVALSSQTLRTIASDHFNGTPSTIFSSIQGGSASAVCGSVSGNALYFNGNGQRLAQTIGLNTIGGGKVLFQLKIANGVAPCDDADTGENVVLEYSTSNGFSWNLMGTYNENNYPQFTPIIATIPPAAQTSNTIFRIRQIANTGIGHDNWVIDDLMIARYDNNWLGYQWSGSTPLTSPNAANTNASPAASGWFTLSGTDPSGGCIYQDSIYVTVYPALDLDVTQDTTLCEISGLQLNAISNLATGISYNWLPNNGTLSNASIADPIATPQGTTTYTVTATAQNGCTATEQVTVTVGQLMDIEVTATNDTICQGQQVQLNAITSGTNEASYSWTNGTTLSSNSIADPIASPITTTTYSCTISDQNSSCSLTDAVTIHVTTGYTANAGADQTLCTALGHQLNVQHNVPDPTYLWSPAGNLNASNIQSPTILNDVSATYSVTITDQNGCSITDQVNITRVYDDVPTDTLVTACANTPPTLNAPQPGITYSWSTGQNTPSIIANTSGDHTITVTNAQGCQAITTFNVVLLQIPIVDLGPDIFLCGTISEELDAGNAGSAFSWSTGATGQVLTVVNDGTYGVTVMNSDGCSSSDEVNVEFNQLPTDVLLDVTSCITDPVTLNAGNAGSTFLWSTGGTDQTITPVVTGNYSVTITTADNCTATYDSYVELLPALSVDLGNDTSICQGQQLILDAGNPGADHEWSNLSNSQTLAVTSSGIFSVTVTNGYCTANDAINVQVNDAPIDPLNDVTECVGGPVILDAGNTGSTFQWSTNENSGSIEVMSSGTYTVSITNDSGCNATFDAIVQFIAPPYVELGADTVLCDGELLLLDAGNAGMQYTWSTGASSRIIPVNSAGSYSVVVSNGYCERNDQIEVHFDPAPDPIPHNKIHFCMDDEPHYVELDAGNPGSTYIWSTDEDDRIIRATEYGWFHVDITNAYGCLRSDSVEVIEFCPSTIFAPNTFTPNNDGLNDMFLPTGTNIASMRLMIFDRWGTMIYQGNGLEGGWDGTYRGEFVTDDIYVWRINYRFFEDKDGTLGRERELTGHIQVLR